MDGLLLPMILLAAGDKPNQKALLSQILPAVLPGPRAQRITVAAITAREHIRQQAQTEQTLVIEAIDAGKFTSAAELTKFPAIEAAFKRLPAAVQSTVFRPAPPAGGGGDPRRSEPT